MGPVASVSQIRTGRLVVAFLIMLTAVAFVALYSETLVPITANGLTSCVIDNTAVEVTQANNWDPRDVDPQSVPLVKYRRTTIRVYLAGDCGTQSSVSGDLYVKNSAGTTLLGPLKPLSGGIRPPSAITQVNRERHGNGSSIDRNFPLSFNVWPWANNGESTLQFVILFSGVDQTGIQSTEKTATFEQRETPRVFGVPLNYMPPGPGTVPPPPWPLKPIGGTSTPSPHYTAGKSGPPQNLGELKTAASLLWSAWPLPEPCGNFLAGGCEGGYLLLPTIPFPWDFSTSDYDPSAAGAIAQRGYSRWPNGDYVFGFLKENLLTNAEGRSETPYHANYYGRKITAGMGDGRTGIVQSLMAHEGGHGLAGMCDRYSLTNLSGQTGWDYFKNPRFADAGVDEYIQSKVANDPAMSAHVGLDADQKTWNDPKEYSEFEFKRGQNVACNATGTRTHFPTSTPTFTTTPPPPSSTPAPTSTGSIPIPSVGPPPNSVVDMVVVSTNVSRTDWRLIGLGSLVNTMEQPPTHVVGSGDDSVRILDSNQGVLFETRLLLDNLDPGLYLTSLVMLPHLSQANSVKIYAAGTEVAALARSSNAPVISITSPSGSHTLQADDTIVWTRSDSDGDEVFVSVDYLCDATNRITPLGFMLKETSITISQEMLDGIPACSSGVIRLRATDGLNTTVTSRDSIGATPDRSPTVNISFPVNGSVVSAGANIVLGAAISDPEDLSFNKTNVSWSSNLEGSLGVGPIKNAVLTTHGTHTITVTVTDSANNSSSASVSVTVQ